MSTIVTRAGKGSPLTHNEVDANFTNLNTDKIQSGNTVAALTITSATISGGTITGITDLAIADGGTGASDASTARTNLGLGTSATTNATAYAPATSGTSILYGNNSGGFNNVTVGSGLSFATGTLSATVSGGVTSVTGTAPVVSSGGTTPDISMASATTSANGYLTSTDWNTFNGKYSTGGALGTPSSGTLTNCTFPTLNQNTTGSSGSCTGNSATATALSTASGSAPSYSARAWVNFNGTGTVAIRASGNVSSLTDNGTGDYTLNFTTAMPDVNYTTVGSGFINVGSYGVMFQVTGPGGTATTYTTSAVQINTRNNETSSLTDSHYVFASIFR